MEKIAAMWHCIIVDSKVLRELRDSSPGELGNFGKSHSGIVTSFGSAFWFFFKLSKEDLRIVTQECLFLSEILKIV